MSTPAEQLPEATIKPRIPSLSLSRFKQAEYARNLFDVQCERGTTVSDLLDETYWAHVATLLRPRDRIEVIPEDNSYFVELMVLASGKLYAQVELMRFHEFEKPVARETESEYRVEWSGGHGKWRVLRGTDIIKEGFDTEKDALRWRDDHEETLAR